MIINGVVTAYDTICVSGTFDANTTEVLETMNVFAMGKEGQSSKAGTNTLPTVYRILKTSDNTQLGYQIGMLLVSLSAVVILFKARNLVTK
mgnify:CR=1 FL=1